LAYEAVPIDVEIQKLTAAERDALSRYKIHENINTILANENVPLLVGGVALLAALPILFNIFLQSLEEQNIILTDQQKDLVKKSYELTFFATPFGAQFLGKKLAEDIFTRLTEFDASKLREFDFGGGGLA
jgi:hypothetical protein